jgi:hypothetical protein
VEGSSRALLPAASKRNESLPQNGRSPREGRAQDLRPLERRRSRGSSTIRQKGFRGAFQLRSGSGRWDGDGLARGNVSSGCARDRDYEEGEGRRPRRASGLRASKTDARQVLARRNSDHGSRNVRLPTQADPAECRTVSSPRGAHRRRAKRAAREVFQVEVISRLRERFADEPRDGRPLSRFPGSPRTRDLSGDGGEPLGLTDSRAIIDESFSITRKPARVRLRNARHTRFPECPRPQRSSGEGEAIAALLILSNAHLTTRHAWLHARSGSTG